MTFQAILLLVWRRLKEKWSRFLLASGGIVVGVWAISLTTSVSLGLSDTIIQAINSLPIVREIQISRTASQQTNFFEVTEPPKFLPINQQDTTRLKQSIAGITSTNPNVDMNIFIHLKNATNTTTCVKSAIALQEAIIPNPITTNKTFDQTQPTQLNTTQEEFGQQCFNLTVISNSFERFYETNKSNWVGPTDTVDREEIILCFRCGAVNLGEKLGFTSPEEMVGQTITVEPQRAPEYYDIGKILDTTNFSRVETEITDSKPYTLKIKAVVDDRNISTFGLPPSYLDISHFNDAFTIAQPQKDINRVGAIQHTIFINDYNDLEKILRKLQDEGYLVFSFGLALIQSVQTAFLVLSGILAIIGLVAMIASVFGIIAVMVISVLERQKEIGVLKSLGARDRDIFVMFLIESSLLGVIGWIIGTVLALLMGLGISALFNIILQSNEQLRENLQELNITSFLPTFPWWLLLGTLLLAILFTVLSGVFPALRAARQNPVEVLRTE